MTCCDLDSSVPDWVIEHPETFALFQALGIDYSCGGKSLGYACREQGLDATAVLAKLHACIVASRRSSTAAREQIMAGPEIEPGSVIDVRPLGAALATTKTSKLLKTERLEIVRLVLPAGKELAEHAAPGDIIVHCLEGRIAFQAAGQTRELAAGQMLHLARGAPHAVKSLEDSSVLVTILLP